MKRRKIYQAYNINNKGANGLKTISSENIIEIAYASDEKYAEMMCVSMVSLLMNTKKRCRFHIIESRLSQETIAKICSLKERFPDAYWEIHTVDLDIFSEYDVKSFSVEAFYRVLLANILPKSNKAIYLDCDTVVTGDIADLWNIELDSCLAAAAPEKNRKDFDKKKKILEMDCNDVYFNSGVLVLNLYQMRKENILDKFIKCIPHIYHEYISNSLPWFVDQEPLNYLFKKRLVKLPPRMNAMHEWIYHDIEYMSLDDWVDSVKNPLILHYIARPKPAFLSYQIQPCENWELYYFYKNLSPYSDIENDERRIAEYKRLEKNTREGLFLGIQPNYLLAVKDSAKQVKELLKEKKLAFWGFGMYLQTIMVEFADMGLSADVIVDGLPEKQGEKVFGSTVKNPDVLRGKDYFVVISMVNPPRTVFSMLSSLGIGENDIFHIFSQLRKQIQ